MSAQFTRAGDPNDDRGPSMMVRHAEQRAREAAANADRYLRETFPRANATTLALALKEFNNDVALAKDALKEFFEEEDGGEERRAELAEARKKDEEARQKEIVARLRAHGDVSVMREQEILRQKLQIAHRVGDASEAERIKALLSVDDALAKAAKSNYGFRPGD
ncbi:predicted protein [Ostreococcus lucimarinus CCE9901]|uniref:CUE domain-containing protein n=1 Tax=Ostreococcus lucimarinus (strain CCE9901) TaxID=436017 RepID=A4RV69_OSTLU|nr:predicted protein [Ostreococcus lucimarinus CCE9901]ABO95083.1 predicted protein [Ostreococcus lucimarinus CCE9901]|eukprot:XP_001416790.1 predicted protein [Ostreococcus lucimarinus CCE9901]